MYGDFTAQEFKKYLFLGTIFSLCIGLIWSLMPLRDTIFCNMVIGFGQCAGRELREQYVAWARIVALLLMIPAVALYDLLLNRISKKYAVIVLCCIYIFLLMSFGTFFWFSGKTTFLQHPTPWMISAWLWYTLIESLNAIFIAAFWAFTLDVSDEQSAKKGFGFIVMIGQLGGIIMPYVFNRLPRLVSIGAPGLIFCAAGIMGVIAFLIWLFLRRTPAALLRGYQAEQGGKKSTRGSFIGARLIKRHKYLLAILGMIIFFEFVITMFDFNFKLMTFATYSDILSANEFLSRYASMVNITTLLLLVFGINSITRVFGLRVSFILIFISMIACIAVFALSPSLMTMLWLLLITKALNYALKAPAVKQLYVPTTDEVKYNAQAWIETTGAGSAKMMTALVGTSKSLLDFGIYISLISLLSFGLITFWLVLALFVTRTYEHAIDRHENVC